MNKLYPFCKERNEGYPDGGLIVKQVYDKEVWRIEYDTESILKKLKQGDYLNEITKEQLTDLLVLITYEIVEINHYFLGEKGSAL